MTPFFFGEGERRLFGVYEPPAGDRPGTAKAAVFCAPWGPDYVVSHTALCRLGSQLAASGRHVLRFDYYGAGDSAGESEEVDLDGWLDDIGMAIDELKSMAGAPRVALVGLRLGASLAAELAVRRTDVESVVLWDPVVRGAGYLRELQVEHERWVAERSRAKPLPATEIPNRVCHPLPPRLEAQIAAVDLPSQVASLRQKVLLVLSDGVAASEVVEAAPEALRRRMSVEAVADSPPWRQGAFGFGGPMPAQAFKAIAGWLA